MFTKNGDNTELLWMRSKCLRDDDKTTSDSSCFESASTLMSFQRREKSVMTETLLLWKHVMEQSCRMLCNSDLSGFLVSWFLQRDTEFSGLRRPPQSPDLSPAEHLWDVQSTNLQQLCDAVMLTWTKVSEDCFRTLVNPQELRQFWR